MKTVFALYDRSEQANGALGQLKAAGMANSTAQLLQGDEAMQAKIGFDAKGKVIQDCVFATTLGIITFGVFGLLAGVGSMGMGTGMGWALGVVVVFALLGAGFGLFIGSILSVADTEEQALRYREGVARGGIALVLAVDEDRVDQTVSTLKKTQPATLQVCSGAEGTLPKPEQQRSPGIAVRT